MNYSKKLGQRIANLFRDGGRGIAEICEIVGIAQSTFYSWKDPNNSRYRADFAAMIEKAEDDKYLARLALAERGQKKLLEGYFSEEVTEEFDTEGNVTSRKVVKKYVAPHPTIVIHALKSLDPRYNVPERFDHTTAGEKLTPGAPPNIFINTKNAKSLKPEENGHASN